MKAFKKLYNLSVPYSPILREEPIGPIFSAKSSKANTQKLLELTSRFSQDKASVQAK